MKDFLLMFTKEYWTLGVSLVVALLMSLVALITERYLLSFWCFVTGFWVWIAFINELIGDQWRAQAYAWKRLAKWNLDIMHTNELVHVVLEEKRDEVLPSEEEGHTCTTVSESGVPESST